MDDHDLGDLEWDAFDLGDIDSDFIKELLFASIEGGQFADSVLMTEPDAKLVAWALLNAARYISEDLCMPLYKETFSKKSGPVFVPPPKAHVFLWRTLR